MTSHEERAIRSMQVRFGALLALRSALPALTGWAFLYGTHALALRAALGASRPSLLWGLATLPLALVPALMLAWRRLPSRSAVRVLLDHHAGCGGLLMAGEELSLEGWRPLLPPLELPRLHWRSGPAWGLLGAAGVFVLFCFFVPARLSQLLPEQRLEIDREASRLDEQIDLLTAEGALSGKRADELKQELERVRREATGKGPAKTLEAMDHLHNTATTRARDAVASTGQQRQELGKAAALAEVLSKNRSLLGNKALLEGLGELAKLTHGATGKGRLLPKGAERAILESLLQGKGPSAEQLATLAKALEANKEGLAKQAQRLYAARLIDRETLQRFEKAGQRDRDALAAHLKGGPRGLRQELARLTPPGRGGPARGAGTTPTFTWKGESKADRARFKEEALPASALAGLRDYHRNGGSAAGPKVGGGAPASSGALAGARAGAGAADVPIIWPRHRGAVARYFARPGN